MPEDHEVIVAGASIRYSRWEPAATSATRSWTVVLLHGGCAHRHWRDHIAPVIARDRRVNALDLSGHGDSDHRPAHEVVTWAREVMAVAAVEASLRAGERARRHRVRKQARA